MIDILVMFALLPLLVLLLEFVVVFAAMVLYIYSLPANLRIKHPTEKPQGGNNRAKS